MDEVAEIINLKEAQKLAGHTSESTTLIYTIGEENRKLNRLKEVNNSFA